MSRYNDEWRETNHYVGRFLGLTLKVWIILLIVVGLVGAAIWGITVATSGVKGQGDGIIRNNSADNWIAQQGKFEDLYAEYESTQVRIDQFKTVAEANPNDAVSQTNYQGQISHCTDVVADYNAATRSFLSEDWRSVDLPATLDPADCTR